MGGLLGIKGFLRCSGKYWRQFFSGLDYTIAGASGSDSIEICYPKTVTESRSAMGKTKSVNVGLEFGLGGRFSATLEYYNKRSEDLLMNKEVSMATGT